MEVLMELNIVGRNLEVTDRFRAYTAEKAEKVSNLSDRAISLMRSLRPFRSAVLPFEDENGFPG